MKKVTMGIICFTMGALLLSGCSKPNNKATVKSEASTQQSAKKSSESKKESSESSTSESTKEAKVSESSAFKLMIEGAQSQVPKLKEQYEGMYSDISITEGENNTVVYTYTFNEAPGGEVDAEALKPTLVKGLKSTMDAAKVMIPDIKFQVIYLNPDGSEIMNFVITQADTDQVQADAAE